MTEMPPILYHKMYHGLKNTRHPLAIFTFSAVFLKIERMYYYRYKNPFRQADSLTHNPKVAGSNPAPATKKRETKVEQQCSTFFISKEDSLQSLLLKITKLPHADRLLLGSILESKPASTLAMVVASPE
jgi:hypothetical protein